MSPAATGAQPKAASAGGRSGVACSRCGGGVSVGWGGVMAYMTRHEGVLAHLRRFSPIQCTSKYFEVTLK